MRASTPGADGLHLLEALLAQLVEGQYDLWQQVAGRRDLLRAAVRQAVQQAASSEDVAPMLERCWALLTDDRTANRVAEFYRCDPDYEHVPVDHDRVLLGALRLLATAQAAVAALQSGKMPDAAARLDQWSEVAAGLFGGSGRPPVHSSGSDPVGDPAQLVRRVYKRLGGGADGALFWTLDWLDATSVADVVKVPVVGYHPSVGGFCADLRLRLIGGEGELVEHPDMALRPLGPELRDVIGEACRVAAQGRDTHRTGRTRPKVSGPGSGPVRPLQELPVTTPGARSVCWSLTVRDRKLDPLVPLDGGSISGAARTGLLLLHAGQRHDTHSVIVAKADQAGELRPVGFERDKLEAASGSGLRRAVVAPGAALSEADRDDLEARGLKLRKAPDIRTALKVVQARRKRWPIAATVIATGLAIVVAWTFLRPATTPRTPARRASGPTLSAVGDRFTVGDYNGDGKADVAMAYDLGNGTVQVHRWISNGSQFTDLATDQPGPFVLGAVAGRMASGDVTGDGKDDIVMAYQNPNNTFSLHVWSAGITYAGSWYTSDQVGRVGDRFTVGDYNGDGKADVAIAYDRRNGTMQIYRWISTGSQLTELATYESGPFHLSAVGGRIASGDVNGDGKDDIVMAYHYQNDHSFYYHVWSAGIDYAYRLYSGQLNLDRIGARFTVGDYNDDGKADVAMAYDRGNGTMRIYRWNSTGSQFTDLPTHDFGPFNLANVAGRMASGDVNGDGKDDIVMAYQHPDGTFILHVWSAGVVDAGQWYTNQ